MVLKYWAMTKIQIVLKPLLISENQAKCFPHGRLASPQGWSVLVLIGSLRKDGNSAKLLHFLAALTSCHQRCVKHYLPWGRAAGLILYSTREQLATLNPCFYELYSEMIGISSWGVISSKCGVNTLVDLNILLIEEVVIYITCQNYSGNIWNARWNTGRFI